jgi:23S rRNA (cytosine1962-C5)-methyltransferase
MLESLLSAALERRAALLARLKAEGTDCWRLLHGSSEGREGLTLDVYGDVLLVQSFREPLSGEQLATLERWAARALPQVTGWVWNHRGTQRLGAESAAELLAERIIREGGTELCFAARHRGLDPWLFLDLRATRRRIAAEVRGASFLNLFSYTCGAGVRAACAGAAEVINADFSASSLEVGRRSLELNPHASARVEFLHEDCLPLLRQWAGLEVKGRARSRDFLRVEPRGFDLVLLDPPKWSKGPFGAVDVEHDYPALLKPALLATARGGALYATHHLPNLDAAGFEARIRRTAEKAGIDLFAVEVFGPDEDFPGRDGAALLKVARCQRA